MRVFNNHKLNIEIIEEIEGFDIKSYINNIDINNTIPIDALLILKKIKELIK